MAHERKENECSFLMRIQNRMVVVVENGDGQNCTILKFEVDREHSSVKEIVPRIAAWVELVGMVGLDAANAALPGVVV
jgi:hypothetical protein